MFDTGTPQSGKEILASLSRVQGEGEWFVGELAATEFFAPQGAGWSPAEQVRHLTKSMTPVAWALRLPKPFLRLLFGSPSGDARPFAEIVKIYREHLHAGAKAGRFAPSRRPSPADPEPERRTILSRWHSAAASLLKGIALWDEGAMDQYRLPHPILGRLTVREMLFFTAYHQSHHLNLVATRRTNNSSR